MGKLVGGPFGQLSGKTGDLVGSSWKGISTIKRYQPNVSNPQTAGQVAQRGKMSNIVAFAQSILASIIKPLWDRFQSGMSGYNAFVSRNIDLFQDALPSVFADLVTSSGKMDATQIATAAADAAYTSVQVTWLNDAGQGFKLATDKVYLVVINETKGLVKGFASEAVRSDSQVLCEMGVAATLGDVYHIYLSFLRADGSIASVNSYKRIVSA